MEGGKNWEEQELDVLAQHQPFPVLTQRAQNTPSPAQFDRHAGDGLGPILLDFPDLETLPTPHLSSLYNEVPGAGSVAIADASDGALYCLVDVLTANPRVLVAIAASIDPAALVSVSGTAEGAPDGCAE